MKIVSFNINGLNAFDSRGDLERLIGETDADIYCFQETKISSAKEQKMKDIYSKFPLYSDYNCICTVKNGYAGVSTLVHNRVLDRLKRAYYPNILADVETFETYGNGRVAVIEFDTFYVVNAYVPNSGNKKEARMNFDRMMRQFLNSLDKPVVYCGDMNVCSTSLDFWGNYEMYKNSAPGLCQFEIDDFAEMIEECKLVDTYRYKNGDKQEYSWFTPIRRGVYAAWESRHGWRIDYFLVSDSIKDKVEYSKIYEAWNKIDHSPIEIKIDL